MEHNNDNRQNDSGLPDQNNQENQNDHSADNQDNPTHSALSYDNQPANDYDENPDSNEHPFTTHTQEYNDQHRRSNSIPSPNSQPKQRNNWVSGIFGGVIGGIISALIMTLLFTNGIIGEETTTEPTGNTNQEAVEVDSTPMIEELSSGDANVSSNIEETSEAVVGVVNLQQQSVWTGNEEAGTGSGIIYKKEDDKAYVVTNQHVVDGARELEVVLNEDERLPAKVLGEDALTDLAVLEIDGANINTIANIGSSEDLVVGETVLAIGNPLGLEFANSVTKGIISGLNRSVTVDTNRDGQPDWVTEVLQTDAAINPGNSGGALVNTDGKVVGINSMKIAQSTVEGIGFAIPINTALPIIEQLETNSEVARPQIGISTASLYQVPAQYRYEINLPEDVDGGMVIANVQSNSPAEQAGLQQYDVITKIDGNEITSILELRKFLYSETKVGDDVEIEFIRDGERQTTSLELEEMSE